MTSTIYLRAAAIFSFLFAAGHTFGGLTNWSPMGENNVLRSMSDVHFNVMGTSRSYLDFFRGFGWSLSVALFLQSILIWQIATLSRTNARSLRPLIGVLALAQLASGIIAWRFIFPMPALFSIIIVALLGAAFWTRAHQPA